MSCLPLQVLLGVRVGTAGLRLSETPLRPEQGRGWGESDQLEPGGAGPEQRTVPSASATTHVAPFCLVLPSSAPLSSFRLLCKAPEDGALSREQNPALLPGDVSSGPLAHSSEKVWSHRPPLGRRRVGTCTGGGVRLCSVASAVQRPLDTRPGCRGPVQARLVCRAPVLALGRGSAALGAHWAQGRQRGGRPRNCGEVFCLLRGQTWPCPAAPGVWSQR